MRSVSWQSDAADLIGRKNAELVECYQELAALRAECADMRAVLSLARLSDHQRRKRATECGCWACEVARDYLAGTLASEEMETVRAHAQAITAGEG